MSTQQSSHPGGELHRHLQEHFGFSDFRPLQEEIITGTLKGENSFVLMPTGGGKSLCYQLPAIMMSGVTIVVSPLIALMKDQVDALVSSGIPAAYINSSLDQLAIEHRRSELLAGNLKLVYVAPERLMMPDFLALLDRIDLSLIAIDEAHCISEWGHDFRMEYRRLSTIRRRFPDVPMIAMTATANERVREDILAQLDFGSDAKTYVAGFDRPNLFYSVVRKSRGIGQVIDVIERHRGESGIIYCASRAATEALSQQLSSEGYRALPYHAGLSREERESNQEKFERDEIDIICATIAFGMGIDKPDVRFVIHHDFPKTIMSYYQETGRAGRDGLPSECLLLYNPGDRAKILHFINEKPDPAERQVALAHLDEMTSFATSGDCRRKLLLHHFGETYPKENCETCDNCTRPEGVETVDMTRMAQMYLSTVVRLNQGFGASYVIDILKGSEARKILSNRHTELSTWGIGKEYSKEEWKWLAGTLVTEGYAVQRPEQYNTVALTPKGWDVLRGSAQVIVRRHREMVRPATAEYPSGNDRPLEGTHRQLFDRLKQLRKKMADRLEVPPYIIFGDRTLKEMSTEVPRTMEELFRIHGIGRVKAERYGRDFLEVICRFAEEHQEITSARPTAPAPAGLSGTAPRRAEFSMTVLQTRDLFRMGKSVEEIAADRGLTSGTIYAHLDELVRGGEMESLDSIVSGEKLKKIRKGFEEYGIDALKPVIEGIGDPDISYEELRLVRSFDYYAPTAATG